MKKSAALFFAILMLTMTAAYAGPSAESIVKKVKKQYTKVKTLSVEFEQKFNWKLAGTSDTITGKMLIKGNTKYRVEMPDNMLITDGNTVWQYSVTNKQVIIDQADKSGSSQMPSDFLLKYADGYAPRLVGEELLNGKKCYVLNLKSITGDDYYQRIKVWIDKKNYLTQKLEQYDINENVNIYTMKSVLQNVPVADAKFRFLVPPGVEIIDLR